ncbi:MAG: acyl carrier protein [Nannocystis sp.]|nr:acyl carrier protein [Nannocystis sp.]MBA3546714.1 acyl carrier protein [Nannocystis sp.]
MIPTAAHHYEDVLAKIFEYLEDQLTQRPRHPITAQSHLVRDLGLDSLQSFEMLSDLEDHFHVVIPMDLFQHVTTLEDVAHAVLKVIQAEAA